MRLLSIATLRPVRSLVVATQVSGVLGLAGLIAAIVARKPLNLVAVVVLLLPAIVAWLVTRRAIHLTDEGMENVTLFGKRLIIWADFQRIDQSRKSFVFVTNRGVISAGWIDPARRDLLFRKTLEKAKLVFRPGQPRWGLRAQYVRRDQPITLQMPDKKS